MITPVLNESGNLSEFLGKASRFLESRFYDYEIILVDDGSIDGSAEVIKKYIFSNKRIVLLRGLINEGYGSAIRKGIDKASKEFIFITDADLQFDIENVDDFIKELPNCQIIAGFRIKRADNRARIIAGFLWNKIVCAALRIKSKDINCAFKIFRTSLLKKMKLTSRGALINAEIYFWAKKTGARIKELPVRHYKRTKGSQTGLRPVVVLRAMRELIQFWFKNVFLVKFEKYS